jgi:serine/threonine protein kinase
MNSLASQPALADPALAALIDAYTALRQAGGPADPEAFARNHPEHADTLRRLLPLLEVLDDLGNSSGSSRPRGVPEALGELGDFRLRREIGRGGMGVVYEAEQISLRRRVALKVLPFAAALDPRQLQRFQKEAQAAAHLHHTNIVPVHAIGLDRGFPFYAMQLIDGQSLAEVIRTLRHEGPSRPDTLRAALASEASHQAPSYFRAVARLGVQAAEALDYAHEQGVIHRDIKPANLLLDSAGQLWVADFGLARFRAEPALSASGDVVGTLRYMSPEQALAKRALVDHRSDIYGLGVTLYEALTLEPAFPAVDREELLRQIAAGQPRPPRRINPALPTELETLVLKAMAPEPEGRYATAGEMADDLRRFLEDRPVLARKPSLGFRAARWARRHQPLMAAAVGVLLLALAGFITATLLLWQAHQDKEKALIQARAGEAEARAQRRRAEENFRRALEGATGILMQLDPRPDSPPLEGAALHRALEEQGVRFFRQFIDEANPDPAVRFESARAYRLLATVYCSRRDIAQARPTMERAFALLADLVAAHPAEGAYCKEEIQAHYCMSLMYKSLGYPEEARAEYLRTAELCRRVDLFAGSPDALNACAWFLVDCPDEAIRDPALALDFAEKAVALQPDCERYWHTLGVARFRAGHWAAAREALEKAIEIGEGGGGYEWFFLAMACWRQGDRDSARTWQAKAVRALENNPYPPEDLSRYRAEAEALLRD